MTPVQRLLSQLQKDQEMRNCRFNKDGEKVCCFKAEDEASGIVWAIALPRTVAGPASPGADVSLVSAIRGPSTIARKPA